MSSTCGTSADIDAVMARTAGRPHPSRNNLCVRRRFHSDFLLAASAVAVLVVAVNITAAALLAFTIFFYAVVYTMWLKRRTAQNIVIGGANNQSASAGDWLDCRDRPHRTRASSFYS